MYNLGIMDKALGSSKQNIGKVLQKDGVGDTIKENEQGDINNEQRKAERSKAQLTPDRGTESSSLESESGTRKENENRSRIQGDVGRTSQEVGEALTSDRGINGITTDRDILYHTTTKMSTKTLNNSISAHDVGFYFYSAKNLLC